MRFFRKWFRRNYCECGNPKSCKGKYRFLVLFDIRGLYPFGCRASLNYERAARCTEHNLLTSKMHRDFKDLEESYKK